MESFIDRYRNEYIDWYVTDINIQLIGKYINLTLVCLCFIRFEGNIDWGTEYIFLMDN